MMVTTTWQLGLVVGVREDLEAWFRRLLDLGIPTCQVIATAEDIVSRDIVAPVARARDRTGINISGVFVSFEGQTYNRKTGPETDGLVPERFREKRTELLIAAARNLLAMGVRNVISHVGSIPDDERDPVYGKFLDAMTRIARALKADDQIFCFETGPELPSTLKRTIEDVGTGNLFVNFDPANLILYGCTRPLDAVAVYGPLIRGFHAKDGMWPDAKDPLGRQTRLGEGQVNIPLVMRRLKSVGFAGPVTIEQEVSGADPAGDLGQVARYLAPCL